MCGGPGAIYECGCNDILPGACDCEGSVLDACGCAAGTVFPVSVAQMLSLATTTPRRFLTTANAFIWMHVECAVAMAFLQGNVTAKAMFWTIVKFAEATISQGASVAPIQTRATTIRWP